MFALWLALLNIIYKYCTCKHTHTQHAMHMLHTNTLYLAAGQYCMLALLLTNCNMHNWVHAKRNAMKFHILQLVFHFEHCFTVAKATVHTFTPCFIFSYTHSIPLLFPSFLFLCRAASVCSFSLHSAPVHFIWNHMYRSTELRTGVFSLVQYQYWGWIVTLTECIYEP